MSIQHPFTRLLCFSLLSVLTLSLAQSGTTDQMSREELMQQARLYYVRGDCELAQYLYQQALDRDTNNNTAQLGLGRSLACQGAMLEASTVYQQLLTSDPNNLEAHLELSMAQLQRYRSNPNSSTSEAALASISRAEQLAPQDARVFNVKGIYYYETRQFEQARSAFERSLSLADGLSRVEQAQMHINLGRVQRLLNQDVLATTSFRRGISLNPTNAEAHDLLGQMYLLEGTERCEDALYELNQAYFLAPRSLSIVANLATAMFECGDQAGAIPYFQEALSLDGLSFPELYSTLARAYLEVGQIDNALSEAQKGALLPPERAEAFWVLGQVYQRKGEANAAREAYNRALQIDPEYTPARDALGNL